MNASSQRGQITTFYSYKGGMGRTMLLANVAWILASAGKRVLMIDWDLEAPGLHHYFHPFLIDPRLEATDGLIDMVVAYSQEAVTPEEQGGGAWIDRAAEVGRFIAGINYTFPENGLLHLLPAGKQNASFSVRVNTFHWDDFYERLNGGAFLELVKKKLQNDCDYDHILIDSRTGVSDTSGICTVQMPERIVVCFTASEQSIRGSATVAASVWAQWERLQALTRDEQTKAGGHHRIFPILTRVEASEKDKLDAARAYVRQVFGYLRYLSEEYWNKAEVNYWSFYAFEEVLAVFGDRFRTESSLLAACEYVVSLITDGAISDFALPEPAERERILAAYERRAAREVATQSPTGPQLFPGGAPATKVPLAFPGKVYALSNIPLAVPLHFVGRDESLAAIETAMKGKRGRVAITALHGLRGVGKTVLAAAYADAHRDDYRATWWIRAQTESTMRADIVALGIRLGWVAADDKEEPALAVVMERLRHEGEGILLIFDDAIDAQALKPYLPLGGVARVLITSNARDWRSVSEPVEIRVWPTNVGADFLIARTGRSGERSQAEALSKALGGLPLAHEQAAAYCDRLDISLAEYRKRFEAMPMRLLDDTRHAPLEHDGVTVAKSFALAIEEAAKLNRTAEPLVVHAALLAPEPIPLFLFAEGREKLGASLAESLADDGLDESIAALRTFALIDRESIMDERDPSITTDCIRLHRLVREVAAARPEADARAKLRCTLAAAMAAVYPTDGYSNPAAWSRCALLTPHLIAICETEIADTAVERAVLLNRAGSYFHGRAAYSAARPLFERALVILENERGPEHPATASVLNNLALLLQDQGDLAAARPLLERALGILEKALGREHPDTARGLNNLGVLLRAQGDLASARPLFERALAIYERALGPEHPDTARALNDLGVLLRAQGDLVAARPLFERALAIYERALGPEHRYRAQGLNNLAVLLEAQGDIAAARPLFERALAIREKVLGPEHPETARSLNDLGRALEVQGDLAAARPLFERALAIREKVLGPEHLDTARSLNDLAHELKEQGDLAAARPLFERALAIYEKTLGPTHRDTAIVRKNLANLPSRTG
jgi:tetratricopeptide (TPR) repeat protein